MSNLTGMGIDAVRTAIVDGLDAAKGSVAARSVRVNARQARGFRAAREHLDAARASHRQDGDAECVASDLHAVLQALRDVTGEVAGDALLDRVFSEFCIGK